MSLIFFGAIIFYFKNQSTYYRKYAVGDPESRPYGRVRQYSFQGTNNARNNENDGEELYY